MKNEFNLKVCQNCRGFVPFDHGIIHPSSFWIPSQLIVTGDAAATASQIMASIGLFRMGIGAD